MTDFNHDPAAALEKGRDALVPKVGEQVTDAVRSMLDTHWEVVGVDDPGLFIVVGWFGNSPHIGYGGRIVQVLIDGKPYDISIKPGDPPG